MEHLTVRDLLDAVDPSNDVPPDTVVTVRVDGRNIPIENVVVERDRGGAAVILRAGEVTEGKE